MDGISLLGKSILLVEDEALVALAEKKVLETEGYQVTIAANGETAVEFVRNNQYPVDLILMDIDLGKGMDGTEAAQEILNYKDIPILFLTSHTEREYILKAEKISSYGFVVKHTGDLVLIASIQMAFRLAEANRKIARELEERIRVEEALRKSEFQLQRAELASKSGNWELDLSKSIMRASQGAEKIYGLNGSSFQYEMIKNIPLPEYRPLMDQALRDLIQNEKPYDIEFQIRSADTGEIKDIHSVAFYDKDKKIVFGVIQDITSLKKAEKALKENELLWRFALEGAGHGVWDWKIPSGEVYFSPQWKAIIGYRDDEIENRFEEWEKRVHPEDMPQVLRALDDFLNDRVEVYECEHRLRCKDGTYRWVLDRGKVMERSADGKPIRAIGTHTDITERMESEERIRNLLKEKELLLRETHHRILNNLSVIRSLLSLQAGEVSSPEAAASLREAQGRVDSMRILYEKLFRSQNLKEVSALSYFSDLVEDVLNIFPGGNRISLKLELEDVSIHPKQLVPLGIIVNELISNALKYAFPRRKKGEIQIQLSRISQDTPHNGKIRIEVSDNGVGFPEASLSPDGVYRAIFNGGNSTLPQERKGFGIELISVLTEQIEGTCQLESYAGKGSRIILEFFLQSPPDEGV
jgi:PAS domain S-box-containing protein